MKGRRTWLQTFGVGVLMSGAFASAQAPNPETTSREVVSASGCLQRAAVAEATPGGQPVAEAFVLQGARIGGTSAEARVSGNDEVSPRPRNTGLLLAADRGVDLVEHIGHQVKVTGRLSSFAALDGVASTASGRTLTVTKVMQIATACTPES